MNFGKKLAAASVIGLALVGAVACSRRDSSIRSNQIPPVNQKTTVVFWHGMQGSQEKALQGLVHDFETANPQIKVKLEQQGNYDDLQAKLNSTMQSPKNLPTLTQAYPGWLQSAAKNQLLVDLKPYMRNKAVGWGKHSVGIKQDMLDSAKINGKQYGMPFNKSIEVLIYNPTLLKRYGIQKVPATMAELKQAAQTIYKKSKQQVVGAGFDNLNNYYVLGMKNQGQNFSSKIDFKGSQSRQVINYFAEGEKAGYFRMPGSDKYLYIPFTNQKLAMFLTSSSTETWIKQAAKPGFNYQVAARPGKYTMQQGTDLYLFNNASAMQKAAAFKLMKYLTSKGSQLKWAQKTGYLPVSEKAAAAAAYKANKQLKLPAQLETVLATNSLYSVPVTKNSNATFSQLTPIMQSILAAAQKQRNVDQAILTGQSKFDAAWQQ
ncbi:extracellular solute-binding protein [Lactobacillus xylocopicola]|uniref:Sugar ABC transporter substrate-binding protein n=1 Tax=Lactobacillus xylocopicola TaxID=2976676 RepID=A0ABN6SK22_9LACO|nr:extracellular solute-binding protein [Lactobacillus xylocopicola]BDR60003.1 sugar ABC transporter substrate-binding protein [Lactobacillus xylocopicola]